MSFQKLVHSIDSWRNILGFATPTGWFRLSTTSSDTRTAHSIELPDLLKNAPIPSSATLAELIDMGSTDQIWYLLQHSPELASNPLPHVPSLTYPIHAVTDAYSTNSVSVAMLLLNARACVNSTDEEGEIALHNAAYFATPAISSSGPQ